MWCTTFFFKGCRPSIFVFGQGLSIWRYCAVDIQNMGSRRYCYIVPDPNFFPVLFHFCNLMRQNEMSHLRFLCGIASGGNKTRAHNGRQLVV